MTSVLIVVICVLTAAFVLLPLRSRVSNATIEYSNDAHSHSASPRELLIEERDSLLRQLKELEFDRSMDKINAADYDLLRAELSEQATQVLQRLETDETNDAVVASDFDIEAEVLVARARRKRMSQNASLSGASWTCECGRAMSESDKFCANCGAPRVAVSAV
jgi:hypothetical protein